MVNFGALSARRGARATEYYTEHDRDAGRTADRYYRAGDERKATTPGRWMGGIAASCGLAGEVSIEEFLRVFDGRDPRTGERWMQRRRNSIAGIDGALSVPKTVTAGIVLSHPETSAAMCAVDDEAAEVFLDYLRRHVKLMRWGANGKYSGMATELLAVTFDHMTSRPSTKRDARYPNPNRHKHVILLGGRRPDGKLGALDFRALKLAQAELGAVYHCALGTGLAAIGFRIERETSGGVGFEIAGVPKALCDGWSERKWEILANRPAAIAQFREKYGREPNKQELRDLDLRCKLPKQPTAHDIELFWQEYGRAHGSTLEMWEALREENILPSPTDGRAQVRAELLGPTGLTREHAAFTTQWLHILALRKATGVITVPDCERVINDLIADGDVVSVGHNRWTTRAMLEQEKSVLAWRERRWELSSPPVPSRQDLWDAIRRQQEARNITLSSEQLVAVAAMVSQRYTAVTGAAGTGKTGAVAVAADVWQRQHRRVFALAVPGVAAQRLGEAIGDEVTPMTLDGFLVRLERGLLELRDDDVIVLDEAGVVDTPRWARFVSVVKDRATVVALGDEAQLSPLSAGGLWPLLAKGGPELQEDHRAKQRWERAARRLVRAGDAGRGVRLYARCGHVSVRDAREESRAALIAAWDADGRTGLIITDKNNRERDGLNTQAQERRVAAGELGPVGVALSPTGSRFHVNDRVIFSQQWRIGGGIRRVENGTRGTVVAVDPVRNVVTVRTAEQHSRDLEIAAGSDVQLQLAYAMHVRKAQGITVDTAYVLTGGWQTDREGFYVLCSRSREATWLFLDRESLGAGNDGDALAVLAERGQRSRAKRAALASRRGGEDGAHGIQRTRRRGSRALAPLRPLADRFWRRQELAAARAAARRRRADDAAIERFRQRRRRPQTLDQVAVAEGVPEWVVWAYQETTGTPYSHRTNGL